MSDGAGDGNLQRSLNKMLTKQSIELHGSDDPNSYAVYGQDVSIRTIPIADRVAGSNKVKITPIVSYDWAIKHYPGQQVAVDRTQKYVAYTLKAKQGGIVRLIHRQLAERALIKIYNGVVVDIAFANSEDDILASLDDSSTLFVHKIELDAANHVITSVMLQINWRTAAAAIDLRRVVWCMHLPEHSASDDEDEEDVDKNMNLATIIGSKVYVLNVAQLSSEHGPSSQQYSDVSGSTIEICDHTKKVVAATFSPDGTAIATASEDGFAFFFSVDMMNPTNPSCLFKWSPHNGRPISMLAFLDNHVEHSSDGQHWKYAVTGAINNTELKIWSCESWECLQTIRFSPADASVPSCFIANLDLTSKYLAMSDITRRVLYILQIHQDDTAAHISSISEFSLGAPILSFAIMDIRRKQLFDNNDSEDEDEDDAMNGDEERKFKKGISVHIAAVQPKNLQDMIISFTPLSTVPVDSVSTTTGVSSTSTDAHIPVDGLSDLSASQALSTVTATSHTRETADSITLEAASPTPDVPHDITSSLDELTIASASKHSTPSSIDSDVEKYSGRGAGALPPRYMSSTSTESPVLLTPQAFTTSSPSAINAQLDSLVSPASGHSSLTHVTLMQDNSSLVIGGSAFNAGTASSVSSMNLTIRSSITDGLQFNTSQLTPPAQLAPASIPPPSESTTPLASEDTARQLEEIFGSSICHSGDGVGIPPPLSDIPILTEADRLNQTPTSSQSTGVDSVLVTAIEPLVMTGAAVPPPPAVVPVTGSLAYDTKIWPRPPQPPSEEAGVETGNTDESDETDDSDHNVSSEKASTDEELSVKDIERDVEQEETTAVQNGKKVEVAEAGAAAPHPATLLHEQFTTHLEDMKASILTLNEMMMSQGRDIHLLKSSDSSNPKLDKLSKQIQTLSSTINTKLEHTVNSVKREQKIMQDKLVSQTTSRLSQELRSLVEKSVTAEIKKSVIPAISQMVEPVKRDLHNVMAEKLTAADSTMRESLNRLVNSQSTIDKIGQSVGLVVRDVMQTTHRDSLTQQVLPSFDSSIRGAFSQLNQVFSDGLNDYMKQLNDNMDRVKTKQMNTQSIVAASCDSAVESLNQASKDIQTHVSKVVRAEVQQQVSASLNSMRVQLVNDVQTAVRQEVASGLEGQHRSLSGQLEALRSATATPAPGAQQDIALIKMQIGRLVDQQDYEGAFKQALDATNLAVVTFLLGKLPDSSSVFTDPCPLSQPMLLSLIQQLSIGLQQISSSQLGLVFDYLMDAILNLDVENSVVAKNMAIVADFKERLIEYKTKYPNSEHRRAVAGIEKSIKGLLRYANI